MNDESVSFSKIPFCFVRLSLKQEACKPGYEKKITTRTTIITSASYTR